MRKGAPALENESLSTGFILSRTTYLQMQRLHRTSYDLPSKNQQPTKAWKSGQSGAALTPREPPTEDNLLGWDRGIGFPSIKSQDILLPRNLSEAQAVPSRSVCQHSAAPKLVERPVYEDSSVSSDSHSSDLDTHVYTNSPAAFIWLRGTRDESFVGSPNV